MEVEAASAPELVSKLRHALPEVAPRGRGRDSRSCEAWIVCNALSALVRSGRLTYPVRLESGDRPDFKLTSGATETGIEVTELVDEELASARAKANTRPGADDLAFISPGRRRALLAEYRWGMDGPSPEQRLSRGLAKVVSLKQTKALKRGFRLFERNWLLVYCNEQPSYAPEIQIVMSELLTHISEPHPFDSLLVLDTPELAIWDGLSVEVLQAELIS